MSLVVVVFLVEELILYIELTVETWELLDCVWKHCSSCRMDGLYVETPLYSVLKDRLKNLSLDLLSPLLWKLF